MVAGFRLGTAVEFTSNGPRVFVSASGVGYYGPTGDARIAEGAPAGHDFVARMAAAWDVDAVDPRR